MDGYKIDREIGGRIGLLRNGKEESQEQLAVAIGETRETINNWERGIRHLKADAIIKLAGHFGVSCDYLLTGDEEMLSQVPNIQIACKTTGLSTAAVSKLQDSKGQIFSPVRVLSLLLEDDSDNYSFVSILELIGEAMSNATQAKVHHERDKNTGSKMNRVVINALQDIEHAGYLAMTRSGAARYCCNSASMSFNNLLARRIIDPLQNYLQSEITESDDQDEMDTVQQYFGIVQTAHSLSEDFAVDALNGTFDSYPKFDEE